MIKKDLVRMDKATGLVVSCRNAHQQKRRRQRFCFHLSRSLNPKSVVCPALVCGRRLAILSLIPQYGLAVTSHLFCALQLLADFISLQEMHLQCRRIGVAVEEHVVAHV